jgi:hypothetical protein
MASYFQQIAQINADKIHLQPICVYLREMYLLSTVNQQLPTFPKGMSCNKKLSAKKILKHSCTIFV